MPRRWIWMLLVLVATAGANDFVGSTTCAGCHAETYRAWRGSHHDLAMQHADDANVLGDFDDAEFTYGGTTTTFFRRDGGHFVRTAGADGKLTEYLVEYTFGVAPLQQYLIPFADGRLQALSIAWDSRPAANGGQRWFHLYPDDAVDHRHELHWTGPQQNWNFMCASCHSTNLDKGFDADTRTFKTTWSEVNVGCEACHGPAAAHLRWAAQEGFAKPSQHSVGADLSANEGRKVNNLQDVRGQVRSHSDSPLTFATASLPSDQRSGSGTKGLGDFQLDRVSAWPIDPATGSAVPKPAADGHQVEVCADCHARRSEIAPGHERSPRLLDHFMPAFLTEGLYHADGQIDGEVFEWGSFVQSRMFEAGVVCSDCHEPHSLKLRAPDDAVCAQCHLPQRFASQAHHHHAEESEGARCVGCHMPAKTYMVVDPRHDHSLRIPRPDQSVAFGAPNACNNCHDERSVAWAAGHFAEWYPNAKPVRQTWTQAFASARAGNPAAEQQLAAIAADPELPAIVRGTAVLELAPFFTAASIGVLPSALNDDSPLLRLAGLRALEVLPPAQRYPLAAEWLNDPLLALRAEAGRMLAGVPPLTLPTSERAPLEGAIADHLATLEHNADRAFAHTELGAFYASQGKLPQSEDAYRQAIKMDLGYVPAYANLADLLRHSGRDQEAAAVLERGLAVRPEAAELHHAQGLLRVRSGDMTAALASLGRAATLAPESVRFAYVYAIALSSTGDRPLALQTLREASAAHPYDRDILLALVTMNVEANAMDMAREHLTRLLDVWPDDIQAQRLQNALRYP